MLDDYFSMRINEAGQLESIPLLLQNYTPDFNKLPLFLIRLGTQVNWESEQECFETFLRELAYFYRPERMFARDEAMPPAEAKAIEKAERWQVEHVLFPCFRRYLAAPQKLLEQDIVQVADLPDLYKVFERC